MIPSLLLKAKRLNRTTQSSPQSAGEMVDGLSTQLGNVQNPYTNYSYENVITYVNTILVTFYTF